MFCQTPNGESQKPGSVTRRNKKRKAKRKNRNKSKRKVRKNPSTLGITMSSWAENFAVAATWQLNHQVAYWKAHAKALEYENTVLHDVIRRNNFVVRSSSNTGKKMRMETEVDNSETESDEAHDEEVQDDEEFEVSEEFIQFLTENAKYKEEAKKELARLRAKEAEQEKENEIIEETRETYEENKERMNQLYGDNWQRISALEMSLLTSFIQESDQTKPQYWPTVPFNFSFS